MTRLSGLLTRRHPAPAAEAPRTLLADVSEFQPDLHDAVYLQWSKACIIRAMYGSAHDDNAWFGGARRDALHKGGALFVGIYQYLVAGQSAVVQAQALLDLIGRLRPGEKLICDLEEGAGSQAGRWQAWAKVIEAGTGDRPWLYSDLGFAESHGLAPEWLADFPTTAPLNAPAVPAGEPGQPHILWQFSSNYQVPGIPARCDCSLFHGSVEELAALAYQPAAKPAPKPAAGPQVPADWRQFLALLPALKAGDKDTREPWMVRRVQGLVDALGPSCTVDGVFGPATEAAVKAFQANHGIPQTGVSDTATWSMLLFGRLL